LVAHERGITQARMEIAWRKCMLDLFDVVCPKKRFISERQSEAHSCGSSRFSNGDNGDN
jgi:hypothetical protein